MFAHSVLQACEASLELLQKYYEFPYSVSLEPFLLPPSPHLQHSGRLLFEQEGEDIFLGLEFGTQIFEELNQQKKISWQTLSVVFEESSHFRLLHDTIASQGQLSKLDLEVFGEIDRFLCFLHLQEMVVFQHLCHGKNSIAVLCDRIFQGKNRFDAQHAELELYLEAESIAFFHLKRAFRDVWHHSWFDAKKIHKKTREYLKNLRYHIVGK